MTILHAVFQEHIPRLLIGQELDPGLLPGLVERATAAGRKPVLCAGVLPPLFAATRDDAARAETRYWETVVPGTGRVVAYREGQPAKRSDSFPRITGDAPVGGASAGAPRSAGLARRTSGPPGTEPGVDSSAQINRLRALICDLIILACLVDGVKLLAWDFDWTFLSAHTHGVYELAADNEALHGQIAPDAWLLCAQARRNGLLLAIATHSDAEAFVHGPGAISGGPMVARFMKANAVEWEWEHVAAFYPPYWTKQRAARLGLKEAMSPGKQYHLGLISDATGVPLSEMVLFDDVRENVVEAHKGGSQAVFVKSGHGFGFNHSVCLG